MNYTNYSLYSHAVTPGAFVIIYNQTKRGCTCFLNGIQPSVLETATLGWFIYEKPNLIGQLLASFDTFDELTTDYPELLI